jgi:hypothetical protein
MSEPKPKPFAISRRAVWEAWLRVKANGGAAGVDEQSLAEFEVDLKDNLYKLWNRLSSGSYFPPPVRAVEIPKRDGSPRTLGVPTVADRVAQTVVCGYLEPGVEPHFHPDSSGYRPGRSALDAVGVCRERCWRQAWVLDLDLKSFFDSVPWDLLLKAVARHTDQRFVLLYVERWLKAPLQLEDGSLVERDRGTPQGSAVTAPTQWVTSVGASVRGGDRVADGDLVFVAADQHLAHDESQDPLLLFGVQLVETVAQAGEEAFEGVGELEVGLGVMEVGVERVELGLESGLAFAQRGHPGAQLVEREQLLLVGLDQPLDRAGGAGEVALERLAAASGWVLGAQCVEAAVDLRPDERGVLEQPPDLAPDERLQLVGTDRAALAHAPADVPPVVLADAAVVDDLALGRARGGAVAGVAALAADDQSLQRARLARVALGEARVASKALLREGELLLADERRDRDEHPPIDRLVHAHLAAAVALAAGAGGAGSVRCSV